MTTVTRIANLAMRDSGVLATGQTAQAQDVADLLLRLNMVIAQWNRRRWLVYRLVDTAFRCTGQQSYTVGAGGDFDIPRPDRLEAAYVRQLVPANPTPVDYPLEVIQSREEYAQITLKTLKASPPQSIWYDSGFPLGSVYPVTIPNSQYELHILTKEVLSTFVNTAQEIILPPEYEWALHTTLVNQLRAANRLPVDSYWIGQEKAAMKTIRSSNFQLGRLSMPAALSQVTGGNYNIYSDRGS